jgi:hypothetical protein
MSEPSPTRFPQILETVAQYYDERLRRFGSTPQGVDWNSAESQVLRFSKLLTLIEETATATVLDYGCGYGALADYLRKNGAPHRYIGFDISNGMIDTARATHAAESWCAFTSDPSTLEHADYVVSSGIFNVKLEHSNDQWRAHVLRTLEAFDALARRGFSFNMLSTYSDADKRRDDLFYADPCEMFDRCKRCFSPRVTLLHDYPLYEFTIVVRK